jgi:hypothetical protein
MEPAFLLPLQHSLRPITAKIFFEFGLSNKKPLNIIAVAEGLVL